MTRRNQICPHCQLAQQPSELSRHVLTCRSNRLTQRPKLKPFSEDVEARLVNNAVFRSDQPVQEQVSDRRGRGIPNRHAPPPQQQPKQPERQENTTPTRSDSNKPTNVPDARVRNPSFQTHGSRVGTVPNSVVSESSYVDCESCSLPVGRANYNTHLEHCRRRRCVDCGEVHNHRGLFEVSSSEEEQEESRIIQQPRILQPTQAENGAQREAERSSSTQRFNLLRAARANLANDLANDALINESPNNRVAVGSIQPIPNRTNNNVHEFFQQVRLILMINLEGGAILGALILEEVVSHGLDPASYDSLERVAFDSASNEAESIFCPICQQDTQEADELLKLRCSHFFHESCLKPWFETNTTCPLCKHNQSTVLH